MSSTWSSSSTISRPRSVSITSSMVTMPERSPESVDDQDDVLARFEGAVEEIRDREVLPDHEDVAANRADRRGAVVLDEGGKQPVLQHGGRDVVGRTGLVGRDPGTGKGKGKGKLC